MTVINRKQQAQDISSNTLMLSLELLNNSYDGNCVKLRRSSDDVEFDFGFDSDGILDYSAIDTWLSGSTAYVVTWYDQSGYGNNASQATPANQPILDTVNQEIDFNSASFNYLTVTSSSSIDVGKADFALVTQVKFNVDNIVQQVLMKGTFTLDPTRTYFRQYANTINNIFSIEDIGAPEEAAAYSPITIGSHNIYYATKETGLLSFYENNTLKDTTVISGSYGSLTNGKDLYIGSNSNPAEYLNGSIKKILMYKKNLDSNERTILSNL